MDHPGYCFDTTVFQGAGNEFDVSGFVQRCMSTVSLEELRADLSRFVTSVKSEVRLRTGWLVSYE